MTLHKGQRVRTLTKNVGSTPRRGVLVAVHGTTLEVRWDDGHTSILSDGTVVPERAKRDH
jgi:Domain of unknown function (DUF1918)